MFKLLLISALAVTAISAVPLSTFSKSPPSQSEPGPAIAILRSSNSIAPDGSSYEYNYETANGISAEESGSLISGVPEPAVAAKGFFQFTSPEGIPVHITYVADENGFQPVGDALPTPPPVPATILRALEYIAAHPEPLTVVGPLKARS